MGTTPRGIKGDKELINMRPMAGCIAAACLLTSAAGIARPSCDDEEWFCEETTTTEETIIVEPAAEEPQEVEAGPVEKIDPPKKSKPYSRKKVSKKKKSAQSSSKKTTTKTSTTVVLYEEAESRKPKREWGINLHVDGVLLGKNKAEDAGMGGFGASLRYRPVPAFAFDFSGDLLAGVDWAGETRREFVLMFNGMLFFNPKDVIQFYALGGIGFSWARVDKNDDGDVLDVSDPRYSYFGMQLGAGLEFRVSKRAAFNVDLIGFVRGRTDAAARTSYEFVDKNTGLGSNTSGGGLAQAGVTFYW